MSTEAAKLPFQAHANYGTWSMTLNLLHRLISFRFIRLKHLKRYKLSDLFIDDKSVFLSQVKHKKKFIFKYKKNINIFKNNQTL